MATSTALPPPVGGWDGRESLADMPEDHAVKMENWFPSTDTVDVRRGHTSHATGMSGNVETLVEYVPLSGVGELFAANGGAIYDVSSSGAVGAAVSSGHTNDRWQYANIGTAAGQFVRLVNGADTPLLYNGSTWATTAITGPTAANLVWINVHQKRMWVGEVNSLSAWYLPVNSVSGAATEFPLAGVFKMGGYIMSMGTWTRDSGDGMDDVAVFVTSEGEVAVYQGIDPSAAATWALIGVFRIGEPLGRRCMAKVGSDLVVMTQDGFVPLTRILTTDRSQSRMVALSDQISKPVNDVVRTYKSSFGWQPIVYPKGTYMVFNVPVTASTEQFVFNTITGAPCKFTGQDSLCWGLLNDGLYFGGKDGVVYWADNGTSDNGSNIAADCIQAFSYFGSPQMRKMFKLVEAIFQSEGNPNAAIDWNVDFNLLNPTSTAEASPTNAARWGISRWGIGTWGSAGQIYKGWRKVRGIGRAGSVRVRVNTNSSKPSWISTNVIFDKGGAM